jgi:hypothetical protein
MEQQNLDFEAFARLRGARGKRGLPTWSAVGAALLLTGLFFTVTGSLRAETELLVPAPYTGIVRNHCKVDVSIPSANSSGTLIIPPGGSIEYKVWKPEFQINAYYEGKIFDCKNLVAVPKSVTTQCVSYDFQWDIVTCPPPEPTVKHPSGEKKLKKRVRVVG